MNEAPSSPLRSEVRSADGAVTVVLFGELDADGAVCLATCIDGLIEACEPLVVDLADVTFIDSTGVAALLAARRRLLERGRSMHVSRTSPVVGRVLDVCGLTDLLAGIDGPRPPDAPRDGFALRVDVDRLVVSGPLDALTLPALEAALADALERTDVVELDLSAVDFASVDTARLLLGPIAPRLALVGASQAVERAVRALQRRDPAPADPQ
jgi:anti-anti-sigma factor